MNQLFEITKYGLYESTVGTFTGSLSGWATL